MTITFHLARIPSIHFGVGKLELLPDLARRYGARALLVTGSASLKKSGKFEKISVGLKAKGIDTLDLQISSEPSTTFIDQQRDRFRDWHPDMVIGIGGGSVIDGAKALSAMLPHTNSVLDHLEDVGRNIPHDGRKLPFIAVPTTSGTGGEMTKNAVLSMVGPSGYKKSLRHDHFIPEEVIVDPELMLSCPREVTAACGMDAFTQLLEPYLSPAASPITDALAFSGLEALIPNLERGCGEGAHDVEVRAALAYASMMSGIALANAGLGIVHGLASPLGGFFPIPHGVVCGTLVAEAMAMNLAALRRGEGDARAIPKLAKVALLFGADNRLGPERLAEALIDHLRAWTDALGLPRLSQYGIKAEDLPRIAQGAKNRHNPVALTEKAMVELMARRL